MTESGTASRAPRVVIANHQEWSLRSIESIVAPRGFTVLRAHTGRQAVELALAKRPDAVILDWRMPEIDGLGACRVLRADPRIGPTTPILITTAGSLSRADRVAAYGVGAWDLCTEPLDAEVFLLKLETFVQAKRAFERSSPPPPLAAYRST
jgi:DNA-binding response OmpR family regulator